LLWASFISLLDMLNWSGSNNMFSCYNFFQFEYFCRLLFGPIRLLSEVGSLLLLFSQFLEGLLLFSHQILKLTHSG
jgi:hypothetical protein